MHLTQFPDLLKECYSSAHTVWDPASFSDRSKNITIQQPHAVLHATGVPKPFWKAVTTELASSGFLGRTIVVETGFAAVMPHDVPASPPPLELVERIAWWQTVQRADNNLWLTNPEPLIASDTPKARARLFRHFEEIRQKQRTEGHVRAAIWGRSGQKAAQLALIFAASRAQFDTIPEITVELQDVDRTITLTNWSTRLLVERCLTNVHDSEHQRQMQAILDAIPTRWTKQNDITRRTQRVCDRSVRIRILNDLLESGRIETRTKHTGGPTATEYRKVT